MLSDSDWDSYSASSDDEGQDDLNSIYSGHARSILFGLDESIGRIDGFLTFEKGFLPGDIVCSVMDPSGKMGRVVDLDLIVDLEALSGAVVKAVNARDLIRFHSFSSGDYVVCGQWVGKVVKVVDAVSVFFDDGIKCEIIANNSDIIEPVKANWLEDTQYSYYPGQRVRVKLPSTFICGFKTQRKEGIICHVAVSSVEVSWITSVGTGFNASGPPPSSLQNPEDLYLLSCFSHANWQVGDWCMLRSEYKDHETGMKEGLLPVLYPHDLAKTSGKLERETDQRDHDSKQTFVILNVKTTVNVLWQDGNYSVASDAQTLAPVDNVGVHEFWPEQFVMQRVPDDELISSNSLRVGIVKCMDVKERTVRVKWTVPILNLTCESNEKCKEEVVSAYELVEHPDYSYCVGDVVVRVGSSNGSEIMLQKLSRCSSQITGADSLDELFRMEPFEAQAANVHGCLACVGIVYGIQDGRVEVKWASGDVSKVGPCEIVAIIRPEDTASTPASHEELDTPPSQGILEIDKVSSDLQKERGVQSALNTACSVKNVKHLWGSGAFSLPHVAIGFLTNVASSIFGSQNSSSTKCTSFDKLDNGNQDIENWASSTSSVEVPRLASSTRQINDIQEKEDVIFASAGEKRGILRQFDMVIDFVDHHFLDAKSYTSVLTQVKRSWLKKVQQEWHILEENLPDTIFVRVCEERMDLMRAVIVGPQGTPYHDGLFFFDIYFPPDYPNEPPMVHYISGGLRLNPNLYESGRVCLSLLNTWTGTGSEVWNPEKSTVLQVLLSLLALVLNEKPYFNEAGYDRQIGKAEGEKNSMAYNENAFLLSIKSMLYLLHKPPKHFEALVHEHFRCQSHSILSACKAYMAGAPVGSACSCGKTNSEDHGSSSTGFKIMLSKMFPKLVTGFIDNGIDCHQFLAKMDETFEMG